MEDNRIYNTILDSDEEVKNKLVIYSKINTAVNKYLDRLSSVVKEWNGNISVLCKVESTKDFVTGSTSFICPIYRFRIALKEDEQYLKSKISELILKSVDIKYLEDPDYDIIIS